MATQCREIKRINRRKLVVIKARTIIVSLVLVGFAGGFVTGRATTQEKERVVTVTETVEVPSYEPNSLPVSEEVTYFDVPLSHSLQKYIYEVCADEEVPVALVIAMIDKESQFNPEEVSDTDDYGLMQINECNFTQLQEDYRTADMLDSYQNVFCGIKIIGSYLKTYGDYSKALMAYNMGEYGAKKAWENGIEISSYSKAVLDLFEQYEEVLNNVDE